MICLTKLFQQKRRRIGYILAFSDPTISKRDSSEIIYYLYILSLGDKNTFKNRVWPLWPWPLWPHLYYFQKLQCRATDIIREIQDLRIPHIHSNLQYCFLSFLPYFCLTSHHGFEQTAEKCIIFAEEKQHSAIWKQAFIALVCIFFKEEKLHLSKIFKQA